MICAIDASVALSWVLQDEQSPASDGLFESVAKDGAVVPSLWRLEVANALQIAVRRNRINGAYRDGAIQKLSRLPIEVDADTDAQAWGNTLHLADRYRITVYDAAYLELALRHGVPLATLDQDLERAAFESGATVLPAN
ncbi:MAG: type II toxin-antitoxin system VapC family toxin [Candidatus Acidiferrum sp.]